MQAATSETECKSLYLSICVHHYTLRAPCPKGQGMLPSFAQMCRVTVKRSGAPLPWLVFARDRFAWDLNIVDPHDQCM